MTNYELERIWKKAVMASLRYYSCHLPRGTKENHKTAVKTADVLDKTSNELLPNSSLQHYL
jgi:hypothetical protein